MIRKYFSLFAISFCLLATSCEDHNKAEDLNGIYSFERLNGDYGEIWIDDEYVVIKKKNQPQAMLPYKAAGDTLKMFRNRQDLEDENLLDFLVIQEKTDSTVTILQDGHTNQLSLISRELPELGLNAQTGRMITEQFRERLKEQ